MFLRGPTEPLELPRSIHVSAKARLRTLEKGKMAVGLERIVERTTLRNAVFCERSDLELEVGGARGVFEPLGGRGNRITYCRPRDRTEWQARYSFAVGLSVLAR